MKRTVVLFVGTILAWWGVSMLRSLAIENSQMGYEEPSAQTTSASAYGSGLEQGSEKETQTATRAPQTYIEPNMASVEQLSFEYQQELSNYASLKTKVLPSPEEKAVKESLLSNGPFLVSIGQRLMRLPMLSMGEQDVALDLLIDALRSGDTASAEEALMLIVQDKQVEDLKLDYSAREQMAGIKGEVLYHWAAMVPSGIKQLPKLLPGPVSQRIWQNVVNSHESNLAESRSEGDR